MRCRGIFLAFRDAKLTRHAKKRVATRPQSTSESQKVPVAFNDRTVLDMETGAVLENGAAASPKRLCDRCSGHVRTVFVPLQGRLDPSAAPPSVTWDITALSSEHCGFCALLQHCLVKSGIALDRATFLTGTYNGQELQFRVLEAGGSRRLDYSVQRVKRVSAELSQEVTESSRFDPEELKKWVARCDGHLNCPKYHSNGPFPPDFRLIDVNNVTIVQPATFVKYCALSYVWGTVEQQPLMVRDHGQSPIALDPHKLPETIVDAMALCRDIGIQYLWVDSLCIAHDSETAVLQQIRSMATIYSQCYLGINAAAGDDANAGLPPYGRRKRPICYLIRTTLEGSFVATLSPQIAAEQLVYSKWASRGWTLQEYALARRVIFFLGSYAFYRCEDSLRYEDFGLGLSDTETGDHEIFDLPLPPFYRRTIDATRYYPATFTQMLGQFLHRNLREPTDIVHAFTGILTPFEHQIGSHLWGLPSTAFAAALQWKTEEPFPVPVRVGFPSWSWSGWLHTSRTENVASAKWDGDAYKGFDDVISNQSALACWLLTGEKGQQELKPVARRNVDFDGVDLNSKGDSYVTAAIRLRRDANMLFPSEPESALSFYTDWAPLAASPREQHLFVWASCASLYVDREPYPHAAEAFEFAIRLRPDGDPIGWFELRAEWRKRQSDYLECFAATVGLYPTISDTEGDVEIRLKVILVELLHDARLPVYRRIQVSHRSIKLEDWKATEWQSRLIVLV